MARSWQLKNGIRRVDLTDVRLASSETARRINRDIILQLIRARQPVSRADLARFSGLQRSTVSQIIEQLIAEHWVQEGAVAQLPRGRHPTMLTLNENLVVLAADIHPRQATVAIVDLDGRFLSRSTLPIGSDPVKSVASIVECMKRMRSNHANKSIEGIGISLPGRVDPATQCLIFAPNLNWPSYDIKRAVERAMGLPVAVENAATSCLMSELWLGRLDGVRNAVLITVSEGIGAGILANGQLVTGQHGMAGEFGHISLDPAGRRCGCKLNGCWETFASCTAAVRYFGESAPRAKRISYHELLHLADEGNPDAIRALEKQAVYIGKGLRMVTAALAPEVILVDGDVTSAWDRFGPAIERELQGLTLAGKPPRLERTHEGDVARLRGAAALLLQTHGMHANV